MIKAVIFDCFGVLMGDAYVAIRKEYPEISLGIAKLGVKSNLGLITSEERRRQTADLLGKIGADGEAVLNEVIGGIRRNDKLFAVIKGLRERFKVGLLSNVGPGFWERFSQNEMKEYFDDVVLSYQVGLLKPAPRIFELAAERLGVKCEECVFIDDDEGNVRAAEGCGMKGVVYEWGVDVEVAIRDLL